MVDLPCNSLAACLIMLLVLPATAVVGATSTVGFSW